MRCFGVRVEEAVTPAAISLVRTAQGAMWYGMETGAALQRVPYRMQCSRTLHGIGRGVMLVEALENRLLEFLDLLLHFLCTLRIEFSLLWVQLLQKPQKLARVNSLFIGDIPEDLDGEPVVR